MFHYERQQHGQQQHRTHLVEYLRESLEEGDVGCLVDDGEADGYECGRDEVGEERVGGHLLERAAQLLRHHGSRRSRRADYAGKYGFEQNEVPPRDMECHDGPDDDGDEQYLEQCHPPVPRHGSETAEINLAERHEEDAEHEQWQYGIEHRGKEQGCRGKLRSVGKGEVVGIKVNDRSYIVTTDENGVAKLKINLNPATYTITAQYAKCKVSNKLVVKQTLKLVKKTVTVKKSAKSFKLKATLKWTSGKAITGKQIVFKFQGKTYKAKTNSKGLAQVTLKSSVIKKLKAGKKYSYTAAYGTNKIKGIVKVTK